MAASKSMSLDSVATFPGVQIHGERKSARSAALWRNITTFEQSFQALLKTLKSMEEQEELRSSETIEAPVSLMSSMSQLKGHSTDLMHPGIDEDSQNLEDISLALTKKSVRLQLADGKNGDRRFKNSPIRESVHLQAVASEQRLKAGRRQRLFSVRLASDVKLDALLPKKILKLDENWVDMHRTYEDEADAQLAETYPSVNGVNHNGWERSLTKEDYMTYMNKLVSPVMHPHSPSKIAWDSIGCLLLTCDLVALPIMLAWDLNMEGGFLYTFNASVLYWSIDLFISFNTAYYSSDTIIESRLKICWYYLRTWFFFDLLLVFIDYSCLSFPDSKGGYNKTFSALRNLRVVRLVRLLRITKLYCLNKTIAAFLLAKGSQWITLVVAVLQIVLWNVLYILHIMACLWYYLGRSSYENGREGWLSAANIRNADGLHQYLFCVHWVLAQVTPAPMYVHAQTKQERVFAVSVILFSLSVFGGSLAKLRSAVDSLGKQQAERSAKRSQLTLYLQSQQASVELSARILKFAELQLDRASRSVSEPPLGLVSKALMDELLLCLRRPTLLQHPLFLQFDRPFAFKGPIFKKLCSEGLVVHLYEPQRSVFVEGALAHAMFFIKMGTVELDQPGLIAEKNQSLLSNSTNQFTGICWFAEACLFTRHIHSSTLSTTSIADAFTLSSDNLISCVQSSPIVIVSVCEYAQNFLARLSVFLAMFDAATAVPDHLPPNISEEACQGIHLRMLDRSETRHEECEWVKNRQDLLASLTYKEARTNTDLDATDMGLGASRMTRERQQLPAFLTKLGEAAAASATDSLMVGWGNQYELQAIVSEDIGDEIRLAFPELGTNGFFEALENDAERDCVIAAISSGVFLMSNQYDPFVASQDYHARLTPAQWSEFQAIVEWASIDLDAAHTVFIFLMLRGAVKSNRFAQLCAPKARATRERMLFHCLSDVTGFEDLLPSISRLDPHQTSLIHALCSLYEKFNMPQFLQGENIPHAVMKLQDHVHSAQCDEAFRLYLFSQLCVMCGLSGREQSIGSAFMTARKAVPVLSGVRHIQTIARVPASTVYYSYLVERALYVRLHVNGSEALAVSRLICLSRIVDREALEPLLDAWRNLSADEKIVLTNHFVADGIEEFAIVVLFLPLYLSNALKNSVVGTQRALSILVEMISLFHNRGFGDTESDIVVLDIQSLADFTERVHSSEVFESCVSFIRMRIVGEKIVVLLDQVKHGTVELRDQVAQIQRKVKQISITQAKADDMLTTLVAETSKRREVRKPVELDEVEFFL